MNKILNFLLILTVCGLAWVGYLHWQLSQNVKRMQKFQAAFVTIVEHENLRNKIREIEQVQVIMQQFDRALVISIIEEEQKKRKADHLVPGILD